MVFSSTVALNALKLLASPALKLYEKISGKSKLKNQQPTLSIRLEFRNRGRMVNGLVPTEELIRNDKVFTIDEFGKLERYYNLHWNYVMYLTNDSEYTAYRLRPFEHEGILLQFEPAFDYTKPVQPNETLEYKVKATVENYVGNYIAADTTLKLGPIEVFRLEYTNSQKEVLFYTDFHPTLPDVRDKNVYGKVGDLN